MGSSALSSEWSPCSCSESSSPSASAIRSATRGTTTTSTNSSTSTGFRKRYQVKYFEEISTMGDGRTLTAQRKKQTVDQTKDRLLFYSVQRGARVERKGECKKVNSCTSFSCLSIS